MEFVGNFVLEAQHDDQERARDADAEGAMRALPPRLQSEVRRFVTHRLTRQSRALAACFHRVSISRREGYEPKPS